MLVELGGAGGAADADADGAALGEHAEGEIGEMGLGGGAVFFVDFSGGDVFGGFVAVGQLFGLVDVLGAGADGLVGRVGHERDYRLRVGEGGVVVESLTQVGFP